MVLIKANPDLKKVFTKLIETIKVPVKWTGIFVIVNNNLILAGEVRSLIFNFDNKKVYSNIMEIPMEMEKVQQIPKDPLLANILNMTLYAFGRWGVIKGLTVEKDYVELNRLFQNVLRPINIEPGYRGEDFRFFKEGIQITYEDTILAAIRLMQEEGKMAGGAKQKEQDAQEASGDSEEIKGEEDEDVTENKKAGKTQTEEEYELGLWHSMRWKKETNTFEKSPILESDSSRSRIGNDFYITEYHCPACGKRLYMGVYPVDNELLIETEEARVFMARTYACDSCNSFYTPRPEKLLMEGDVYSLKFNEDRSAYKDYLELLGAKAGMTPNYKFNEFEFQRNRKKKEEEAERSRERAEALKEKDMPYTAEGLSPADGQKKEAYEKRSRRAGKTQHIFGNERAEEGTAQNKSGNKSREEETVRNKSGNKSREEETAQNKVGDGRGEEKTAHNRLGDGREGEVPDHFRSAGADRAQEVLKQERKAALYNKTTEELRSILKKAEYPAAAREVLKEKLTAKYEARMGMLERLAPRQLTDLKKQVEKEEVFDEKEKEEYIKQINGRLFAAEKKALEQKVELGRNKTYAEVDKIIREVKEGEGPEELKRDILDRLQIIKQEKAEREVEKLLSHMPLHMDRKQFADYMGKVDAYKGVDMAPYREYMEKRRDMAEKEEIEHKMKRGGKKDREGLLSLREELRQQNYKQENVEPYLDKIQEKIRQMDEEEIAKICPDIGALSFAEGLEAYEKISRGMFLPELKIRTLEMIERRLTKIKTDESVQLMHKFQREMDEKMPDYAGFYFYDAREEQRKENYRKNLEGRQETTPEAETEAGPNKAMHTAVNRFGGERDKYEYPILVCDTSRAGNGKEGFVLTPDHIFYKSLWNVGKTNILQIESVEVSKKMLSKGIFLKLFTGKRLKLPNTVVPESWEIFAGIMNEFITYLQEKPESRSIGYLAKEKHEVKCCFRCGYTYKGGSICPKCGSKINK